MEFPILKRKIDGKRLIYLDNAATTQKPSKVIDAMTLFYINHNSNINRGIHTLSEESTTMYELARNKVAHFINALPEETIFTSGTTESINFVAQTWARNNLEEGDEILLTIMEHHANIVPWQELAKEKKLKLIFVKLTENHELDIEDYKSKLSNKTKLVAFTHVSNVLGTINPVKQLTELAHDVGAKVLIDGAQAIAHMPINVKSLDVDFYVFSGHKMYGPTGVGVLYINKELFDKTPPYKYGGDMIDQVTLEESTYTTSPQKYEAGTPNIAGVIGLGVAVDYLEKNLSVLEQIEHDLTIYAFEELNKITEVTIVGLPKKIKRAGVISFDIKGIHPHDVAELFNQEGIAIRAGMHCAMPLLKELNYPALNRISFASYNTKEDIDEVIKVIKKIIKIFE